MPAAELTAFDDSAVPAIVYRAMRGGSECRKLCGLERMNGARKPAKRTTWIGWTGSMALPR
jgi:hypothetical protein